MKPAALFLTLALLIGSTPVFANTSEAKASEAVANVLFDFDGSNEFVSYVVRPDGFVDAVLRTTRPNRFTRRSSQNYAPIPTSRACSPVAAGQFAHGFSPNLHWFSRAVFIEKRVDLPHLSYFNSPHLPKAA